MSGDFRALRAFIACFLTIAVGALVGAIFILLPSFLFDALLFGAWPFRKPVELGVAFFFGEPQEIMGWLGGAICAAVWWAWRKHAGPMACAAFFTFVVIFVLLHQYVFPNSELESGQRGPLTTCK
jgi:hypothetical protein